MSMLDRLLEQLKQRGLKIVPGSKPGEICIQGPAAERTPKIMEALKTFRPQLVEKFGLKSEVIKQPDGTVQVDPPREEKPNDDDKEEESSTTKPTPEQLRDYHDRIAVTTEEEYCLLCDRGPVLEDDKIPLANTNPLCSEPECPYKSPDRWNSPGMSSGKHANDSTNANGQEKGSKKPKRKSLDFGKPTD